MFRQATNVCHRRNRESRLPGCPLNTHANNANLAPVLEVFFEKGNFIDEFERSYSNIPEKVSAAGIAFF